MINAARDILDAQNDLNEVLHTPELQPYMKGEVIAPKQVEFFNMNEDEIRLVNKGTRGESKKIIWISIGMIVLLGVLLWLGTISNSSTGTKGSLYLIGFFVVAEGLLWMNYFSIHKKPVGARKGKVVYKRIFKSVSGFADDRKVRVFYQTYIYLEDSNQLVLAVETYKSNYEKLDINSPVLIAMLGNKQIKSFPL